MPGKPQAGSLSSEAKRLTGELGIPVSVEHIRTWTKRGYPLNDIDELQRRLWNQERRPKGLRPPAGSSTAPIEPLTPAEFDAKLAELERSLLSASDYEVARTIRTQIAGLKDSLKISEARGALVAIADVRAAGQAAGFASRAAWDRIVDDLPPLLEGLTSAQMASALRGYARTKCQELCGLF